MKVYLSVPMVANRSLSRALVMARAIEEAGHELTSPWVLGAIEADRPVQLDVFKRDKTGAEVCDVLVADVSEPSTGVGMEIMAAHKAGKRIVLAVKRGHLTSRMLMHMQPKEVIEFDDDRELAEGLEEALSRPVNLK
jgi:hypothetical protein